MANKDQRLIPNGAALADRYAQQAEALGLDLPGPNDIYDEPEDFEALDWLRREAAITYGGREPIGEKV